MHEIYANFGAKFAQTKFGVKILLLIIQTKLYNMTFMRYLGWKYSRDDVGDILPCTSKNVRWLNFWGR